jgi:putative colanic acid biosynthesis acetyltransferase WcaF
VQTISTTSLTWKNKAARALWNLCWLALYRASPVVFHGWRRLLLRCFGATIAGGARPYPGARIWAPWNLVMREESCLADGVDCYCVAPIELGRHAIVSQGTYLCSASHDFRSPDFDLVTAPIHIAEGAWVAARAFVGPGVSIGARAVVAACTVVVRDVPPDTVVAGNPARIVGSVHHA